MPDGEVLHPFAPQNADWDSLWLERDDGAHFHSEARRLINKQIGEPDKARRGERGVHFFQ